MGRRLTDEQRQAQRTEALDRLQTQAAALLTSDGWQAWLRTRATLHSYSANNTLLLLAQALERGFEPTHVAGFNRRTRPEQDDLVDNSLAVFEYEQATATIRSAMVEVDGFKRRQFVVCGDQGTVDIRPLEPPKLLLALDRRRGDHRRGSQEVALPAMPGRYDDQLADLAKIIRGEKRSDYPPQHDLAVHEAVLDASGVSSD